MNTIFTPKILLFATLAAIAAGFGYSAMQPAAQTNSEAVSSILEPTATAAPNQTVSAPTPTTVPAPSPRATALPSNILPTSPLAQVIKLAQAGLDETILMTYITNCNSTFNLDSEKIIYATDAGVPTEVITAMMNRDQQLRESSALPPQQPTLPPAQTVSAPAAAASAEPQNVTVNYFYDTLTPYGTWIEIPGYGTCWRPNVAVYDSGWAPYCDRGSWIYTDCGWYWASDYSWGSTFHYGRWFRDPRWGWCWWPDTVWGPSWVTWRYSDTHCGWAPLPPFAVWQPGIGFVYHGNGVSVGFDFGLPATCYVFVPTVNFCDVQLRGCRVPPSQTTVVFNHTTVINNINVNVNRTVINNGISSTYIAAATHRQIQATAVHDLRNNYYQRVNAVRQDIRAGQNQRRENAEAYVDQRIQNAETRQQHQRDRVSAIQQQRESANINDSQNDWSSQQQANASRRQEIQQAQQNAARRNDSIQNQSANVDSQMNAQRQAVETQREQMRQQVQQVQQEQARQAQAISEARAQQQARVESARQEVQQRIQAAQSERGNGNGNGNGGNGRGNNAQDRNNH